MKQLTGLTNDPKQTMTLTLLGGTVAELTLEWSATQSGWTWGITWGSVVITGQRLATSPNMLRAYLNRVPFGILVRTDGQLDPATLDCFLAGTTTLYLLEGADLTLVESELYGNPSAVIAPVATSEGSTSLIPSTSWGPAGGDLRGTYPNPQVVALHAGTTQLVMGAVADGQFLRRSGSSIVGDSFSGGGDVVGPSSSVAGRFVSFADTTGKAIADSGVSAASFMGAGTGLLKASNLSDLADAVAARSNLGLGSAALQPASAFDPAGAAVTYYEKTAYTPEMYGAVGNGTIDDTAAVQACLKAAAFGASVVGKGTYLVSDRLLVNSGTRIAGLRFKMSSSPTGNLAAAGRVFSIDNRLDVTLDNVTILGPTDWNNYGAFGYTNAMVRISGGSKRCSVINCRILPFMYERPAAKRICRVHTTSNITLSGEQTIDGVACVAGDRVLVCAQNTARQNGIYVVSTGTWSYASDWTGSIPKNTVVRWLSGNTDPGWSKWTTTGPNAVGSDSIPFSVDRDVWPMAAIGVTGSDTKNVIIRNNYVDGLGIWVSSDGAQNVLCAENTVENSLYDAIACYGYAGATELVGFQIINNKLINCGQMGIQNFGISGAGGHQKQVEIVGNIIDGCGMTDAALTLGGTNDGMGISATLYAGSLCNSNSVRRCYGTYGFEVPSLGGLVSSNICEIASDATRNESNYLISGFSATPVVGLYIGNIARNGVRGFVITGDHRELNFVGCICEGVEWEGIRPQLVTSVGHLSVKDCAFTWTRANTKVGSVRTAINIPTVCASSEILNTTVRWLSGSETNPASDYTFYIQGDNCRVTNCRMEANGLTFSAGAPVIATAGATPSGLLLQDNQFKGGAGYNLAGFASPTINNNRGYGPGALRWDPSTGKQQVWSGATWVDLS